MNPTIAVIDIGSNSVRLMIAGAENGRVCRISKNLRTTRLAKGIDATGCLAQDRMKDTVEAIDAFYRSAKALDVPIIAYATSAVRDAGNRDEFVSMVKRETSVSVRVLSGEEEGAFAFSAVTRGAGTVFDIGGGSFQIVTEEHALSVPCGCVRAKEQCDASDPKILSDKLFAWIDARAEVPSAVPQPVYTASEERSRRSARFWRSKIDLIRPDCAESRAKNSIVCCRFFREFQNRCG